MWKIIELFWKMTENCITMVVGHSCTQILFILLSWRMFLEKNKIISNICLSLTFLISYRIKCKFLLKVSQLMTFEFGWKGIHENSYKVFERGGGPVRWEKKHLHTRRTNVQCENNIEKEWRNISTISVFPLNIRRWLKTQFTDRHLSAIFAHQAAKLTENVFGSVKVCYATSCMTILSQFSIVIIFSLDDCCSFCQGQMTLTT